jgi:hypothetical protein
MRTDELLRAIEALVERSQGATRVPRAAAACGFCAGMGDVIDYRNGGVKPCPRCCNGRVRCGDCERRGARQGCFADCPPPTIEVHRRAGNSWA